MRNRPLISYFLTHIAASNFRRTSPASFTTLAFAPSSSTNINNSRSSRPFFLTPRKPFAPSSSSILKTLAASSSSSSFSSLSSSSSSSSSPSIDPTSNTDIEMTSSKSPSCSVRVVSYNLLSSHLAEPDYHTKCEPEHLLATNRLPKLLKQLEEEIESSSSSSSSSKSHPVVFCLQEVSHDWAKALHVFFANKNYHLVTALYGRPFNGYMGVATAFPLDDFELKDMDLVKLSDTRRDGWPKAPAPREDHEPGVITKYIIHPVIGLVMNPINAAYTYLRGNGSGKKSDDAWDYSKYRHNQFIALQLQPRGEGGGEGQGQGEGQAKSFWIGNYHMPCAFRTPAVMNLHADLVADRIQHLASASSSSKKKLPYILAGDFNILPNSPHYTLLTTGTLDANDETYPPMKYGMEFHPTFDAMKSAYATYNHGKEPDYTNAAHNGALDTESFVGTLDYIFLSKSDDCDCESDCDWKVTDVKSLPAIDDLGGGVYPNEKEPSDHLMIAASLEL